MMGLVDYGSGSDPEEEEEEAAVSKFRLHTFL
jgi:hypothetical protein